MGEVLGKAGSVHLGAVLSRHPELREWLIENVAAVAKADPVKGVELMGKLFGGEVRFHGDQVMVAGVAQPAGADPLAASPWREGGSCPAGHVFNPDTLSYEPGVPMSRYHRLAVRVAALERMFAGPALDAVSKDAEARLMKMREGGGDKPSA